MKTIQMKAVLATGLFAFASLGLAQADSISTPRERQENREDRRDDRQENRDDRQEDRQENRDDRQEDRRN